MRAISLVFAVWSACLAATCPAAGLPAGVQAALQEQLRARAVDPGQADLASAIKSAWDAGASQRELQALVREAPHGVQAAELSRAFSDMKDLLGDGLLEREARKAASRSLEARVRARQAGGAQPRTAAASASQGREREQEQARRERERRDEVRSRGGRRAPDGDLAVPTPAAH